MSIDADQLAELEEERRFLLRSLADLEREHDAGDVDEVDYRELKDGYTVRAAAVLRAIDQGKTDLPPKPPIDWRRRALVAAGVVVLIAIVGWALAATSAQRLPGQTATGNDPRDRQQTLLAEARAAQAQDPLAAADLYAEVLADDPDNPEALTYRGWSLAISAFGQDDPEAVTDQLAEGIGSLLAATEADPTYADPHCFLGIIYFNQLRLAADALDHVEVCLASNPPAEVRGLVEGLHDRIVAAIDDPSSDGEPGDSVADATGDR